MTSLSGLPIDKLLSQLVDPRIAIDIPRCRICLSRVLQYSSQKFVDLVPFLPPIVNLMAHSDILIKKTAFMILTKISGFKSEFLLMAVNTLIKDARDSNPTVRALAIKTLCCLDHEAFVEHRMTMILEGVRDPSAYVRRAAVMSTLKLTKDDLTSLKETGVVDKLYELIRDPDPIVVINCLMALEEMLKSEGGVVLNKKIVGFLLKRLDTFTIWGLVYLTKLLEKYQPKTDDEVLDMMNVLDPLLEHNSISVASNTLELFLRLVKNMPHLKKEIFQRCVNGFLTLFASGNTELVAVSIKLLDQHPEFSLDPLSSHHQALYCRLKDPEYLKIQKLTLLCRIINMENFTDILDEVILHCTNKDKDVSLCAINCMKKLVNEWPDLADTLLKAFVKLIKCGKDHVVSNTLQVLVGLPIEMMQNIPDLLEQLCTIAENLSHEDGITAVLYLIGKLDDGSDASLTVVENFVENYQDLSAKVKGQLLVTSMRLLCQRPSEFQPITGELFDLCLQDCGRDVVEQAKFYYTVFEQDLESAIEIFSM